MPARPTRCGPARPPPPLDSRRANGRGVEWPGSTRAARPASSRRRWRAARPPPSRPRCRRAPTSGWHLDGVSASTRLAPARRRARGRRNRAVAPADHRRRRPGRPPPPAPRRPRRWPAASTAPRRAAALRSGRRRSRSPPARQRAASSDSALTHSQVRPASSIVCNRRCCSRSHGTSGSSTLSALPPSRPASDDAGTTGSASRSQPLKRSSRSAASAVAAERARESRERVVDEDVGLGPPLPQQQLRARQVAIDRLGVAPERARLGEVGREPERRAGDRPRIPTFLAEAVTLRPRDAVRRSMPHHVIDAGGEELVGGGAHLLRRGAVLGAAPDERLRAHQRPPVEVRARRGELEEQIAAAGVERLGLGNVDVPGRANRIERHAVALRAAQQPARRRPLA